MMENVVTLLNQKICSIETLASLLDYELFYDMHEEYNQDHHFIYFHNQEPRHSFRFDLHCNEKKIVISYLNHQFVLQIINSTEDQINSFFSIAENILAN